MKYLQLDDRHGQLCWKIESVDRSLSDQTTSDGFHSFTVDGLASDQATTPTGIRDELLILAWIIVLLRTQESSQICFDWAYESQASSAQLEPLYRRLSLDEIIPDTQSTVDQSAAAISCYIASAASFQEVSISSPLSLLLSTSPLSQKSEEPNYEVSA